MTDRRKRRRTNKKSPNLFAEIPYKKIRNTWAPFEIATEAQIEQLHNASMRILENTGIRFQDDEALDLWEAAGAKVDRPTQHVWLDRGLVAERVPIRVVLGNPVHASGDSAAQLDPRDVCVRYHALPTEQGPPGLRDIQGGRLDEGEKR